MRVLLVHIEEVFREAAARWTLIGYFLLSSIFILIFGLAVNLDIVDGALAGAKLFGNEIDMGSQRVDLDKLVLGFESSFSAFLYLIGTFLAIFATAHLVPRLQDKGTIDLYLSRPTGRVPLLLARYIAGLVLAATNIVYLLGTIWVIVIWKTGIVHPRFLLAGLVIMLVIATLLAFAFLIGTVTSSTAVSIMGSYGLFFFSAMLVSHEQIEAVVDKLWKARLIHGLYVALPKTAELGRATIALVSGGEAPVQVAGTVTASPFISTALFGLACLALAGFVFHRKEF